jgi:UDP-N-acetylglucosamine:LPS N-acetylglucosamine transferase
VRDLVTSEELNEIMCSSGLIVCRSGYSTLLDLSVIQKKALLIPTPGQPEQEYLGRGLMAKNLFLNVDQDDLDLKKHVTGSVGLSRLFRISAKLRTRLLPGSTDPKNVTRTIDKSFWNPLNPGIISMSF